MPLGLWDLKTSETSMSSKIPLLQALPGRKVFTLEEKGVPDSIQLSERDTKDLSI